MHKKEKTIQKGNIKFLFIPGGKQVNCITINQIKVKQNFIFSQPHEFHDKSKDSNYFKLSIQYELNNVRQVF